MANKTKLEIEKENKALKAEKKALETAKDKLSEEVNAIRAMVEQLMAGKQETLNVENVKSNEIEEEDIDIIPPNKYIRVTSLCQGALYLSTEPYGRGNVVSFYTFGQTRNITFATLEKIVGSNRAMAENGRYYIQDIKAIRLLMLEDEYKDILDLKAIEAIVNNENSNILEVFKSAPKTQKEHVVNMIIKKVLGGGHIDYNQLSKISEIYGKNIITKIEDAKANQENK